MSRDSFLNHDKGQSKGYHRAKQQEKELSILSLIHI